MKFFLVITLILSFSCGKHHGRKNQPEGTPSKKPNEPNITKNYCKEARRVGLEKKYYTESYYNFLVQTQMTPIFQDYPYLGPIVAYVKCSVLEKNSIRNIVFFL